MPSNRTVDAILKVLYDLKREAQLRDLSDSFIAGIDASITQVRIAAGM